MEIIREALENNSRLEEVKERLKAERERLRLEAEQALHVKQVTEANKLLVRVNPKFSHLTIDDWKDDAGYPYFQLGPGRIYFMNGGLYYFRDRLGFGGYKFTDWDELSVLIGLHKHLESYAFEDIL